MEEGPYIVGWYVTEIVGWTRVDAQGKFVDWGECYTNGLDDIVAWLRRRDCRMFGEVVPDKVARACGWSCVRSAGLLRQTWPGIRWIPSASLRSPWFREMAPAPPKTISTVRIRSYYVAVYGAIQAARD